MTQVYLAPTYGAGWQGLDASGNPLNAGKLYTYQANSSTPLATYTTSIGNVQNANPIVLNSDGRPPSEIWFVAGSSYKLILQDSAGNVIETRDNLPGINDFSAIQSGAIFLLSAVAGTNTITGTASPTLTAYTSGQIFTLIPANTNTGATTLNIDGLGAKNIFTQGVACTGGELISGIPVQVEYDGTRFNILGAAGKYVESVIAIAANFAASNNYDDLVSVSLTAGDWDVTGTMGATLNGATCTLIGLGISFTAGNSSAGLVQGSNFLQSLPPTATADAFISIPSYRVNLTATTTVYLKFRATYSAGQPQSVGGRISARRWR